MSAVESNGRPLRVLVASRAYDGVVGGVERMSIALANALVARGHAVTLLSWDRAEATTFYPLDPRVDWRRIGGGDWRRKAGLRTRLARARRVRREVRRFRPDVMLAFQSGMFIALRLFTLGLLVGGRRIPVIAAERNAPQRFEHVSEGRHRGRIFRLLRLADAVTIQCESYRAGYPKYLQRRLRVISNPVQPVAGQASPGEEEPLMRLLCVGRLSYQKNQPVLLEAFAQVATRYPHWQLVLVGDGDLRDELTLRIQALGLQSRVEMVGAVNDVAPYYEDSHLFVLASRWEGFPNALAEAMAHGLPAVGFRGCAGMEELIVEDQTLDDRTGWLADGNGDAAALAATLARAMDDPAARTVAGAAARAAMRAYAPAAIFDRWESLFRSLARRDAA